MDEHFLYEIMNELYQMEAPIIFKGALITKLVLREHDNPSHMQRMTKDIDADWTGNPPSMEELCSYVQAAVDRVQPGLVVMGKREYAEHRSAGFVVYDQDMRKVTSIDISVRKNPFYRVYEFGDMRFRGASVDKILVDKIAAISSERIIRRVKDLADVYALSLCTEYDSQELMKVAEITGRKMGDFSYFREHKEELCAAYERLKDIDGKVPFKVVYPQVDNFTKPIQRVVQKVKTKEIFKERSPRR